MKKKRVLTEQDAQSVRGGVKTRTGVKAGMAAGTQDAMKRVLFGAAGTEMATKMLQFDFALLGVAYAMQDLQANVETATKLSQFTFA